MTRRSLGLVAVTALLGTVNQGAAMAQKPKPKPNGPLGPPRPRPHDEPN